MITYGYSTETVNGIKGSSGEGLTHAGRCR